MTKKWFNGRIFYKLLLACIGFQKNNNQVITYLVIMINFLTII